MKKISLETKIIFVAVVVLLMIATVYVGISVKSNATQENHVTFVVTQENK